MKQELLIGILPNNTNTDDVGIKLSSVDKILVTKTKSSDTYVVYYKLADFIKLNPIAFIKSLSDILHKNMPNNIFDVEIRGFIKMDNTQYSANDIGLLLNLDSYIQASENTYNIRVTPMMVSISDSGFLIYPSETKTAHFTTGDDDEDDDYDFDYYRKDQHFSDDDYEDDDDDDDEDDYDEDDDEDDDDEDYDNQYDINQLLGMGGELNIRNPFKEMDNQYKKAYKRKSYPSSRIIKTSKHAKRDIKRHGILIESGKARDKDMEIIKSFLKDFIPGKSNWIKSYRKAVLKRWMNHYAITKKMAKKFDKCSQETQKDKKATFKSSGVSKATRGLLKHYNAFYDTSK